MEEVIKLGISGSTNSSETVICKIPHRVYHQLKYIVEHADDNELNGNCPIKGSWTEEEDVLLYSLVVKFGPKRWSDLAQNIPGRNGKQCRERYLNHLDPGIKKGAFDAEEDEIIIRYHHQYGNQWSKIAKHLVGRTPNGVKNRWNCTLRRKSRPAMKMRRRKKKRVGNDGPSNNSLQRRCFPEYLSDQLQNSMINGGITTPPQQPRHMIIEPSRMNDKTKPVVLFQEIFPDSHSNFTSPPQQQNYLQTMRNPNQLPCLPQILEKEFPESDFRNAPQPPFPSKKYVQMEDEEVRRRKTEKMEDEHSPRVVPFKDDEMQPQPPFQEMSTEYSTRTVMQNRNYNFG